jgi:hypothetical protein
MILKLCQELKKKGEKLFHIGGFKNMYQIIYQIKKRLITVACNCLISSVPARARTVDPLIKSQLLYQLSYRDRLWIGNAKLGKNEETEPKFPGEIPGAVFQRKIPRTLSRHKFRPSRAKIPGQ